LYHRLTIVPCWVHVFILLLADCSVMVILVLYWWVLLLNQLLFQTQLVSNRLRLWLLFLRWRYLRCDNEIIFLDQIALVRRLFLAVDEVIWIATLCCQLFWHHFLVLQWFYILSDQTPPILFLCLSKCLFVHIYIHTFYCWQFKFS